MNHNYYNNLIYYKNITKNKNIIIYFFIFNNILNNLNKQPLLNFINYKKSSFYRIKNHYLYNLSYNNLSLIRYYFYDILNDIITSNIFRYRNDNLPINTINIKLKNLKKKKNLYIYWNNYIESEDEIYFELTKAEVKNFFVYINFLLNNKYSEDISFIFFSEDILYNLYYINFYLSNYSIAKLITNRLNIYNWQPIFDFIKFKLHWHFIKKNIFKKNIISINYLPIQCNNTLNKVFLIYRLTNMFWLVRFITNKIFNNILTNNNYTLNIIKYDLDKYDSIYKALYKEYQNEDYIITNELINIICILFEYKDPLVFIRWIKYYMSVLFCKKHNNFLNIIQNMFEDIYFIFGIKKNVIGYKIIFKGKLNKLGNVRKKKVIIKYGYTTLNNVNFKSDYLVDTILTSTGIISIKFIISYI